MSHSKPRQHKCACICQMLFHTHSHTRGTHLRHGNTMEMSTARKFRGLNLDLGQPLNIRERLKYAISMVCSSTKNVCTRAV